MGDEWGGKGTKKKSGGGSKPTPPLRSIVQAASRLNRIKDPRARDTAAIATYDALGDVKDEKLFRALRRAKLPRRDAQALIRARHAGEAPPPPLQGGGTELIPTILDALDRPANAVQGAVVETGGNPLNALTGKTARGALRGLTREEEYSGTQALVGLAVPKKAGKEIERSLPSPVRAATNFTGDVVFDPTNAITFGSGSIATNAARSVAKRVAKDAAESVALSPRAREIYEQLLSRGTKKVLTKAQRADIPRALLRRANRAQGGVRVAGVKLPGSQRLPGVGRKATMPLGPKNPESFLGTAEQWLRPRGKIRQSERRGDVALGTTQDVENIQARVRGNDYLSDLAGERVRRQSKRAVGKRAMKDQDFLDPVRESLDYRGGFWEMAQLPEKQQKLARVLRGLSDEDFEKLVASGRLQSDEARAATLRDQEMHGDVLDLPEHVPQERYYPRYRVEPTSTRPPRVDARGGLPGQTPGTLNPRTRSGAASDFPDVELNPITALSRHARETQQDVGRIEAYRAMSSLTDNAADSTGPGNRLLLSNAEDIKDAKADPRWREVYQERNIPVERAGPDNMIRTRDDKVLLHRDVADEFEKVIRSTQDKTIKRSIEYVNALWARYATASTGFISRNVLQGNIYMGVVLAGANDPRDWAKAMGVMRRLQHGIRKVGDPYKFLKPDEFDIVKGALEHNAVSSGFMETIAAQGAKAAKQSRLLTSRASPISTNFAPLAAISNVNRFAEDWSRLSVYLNMTTKGFDPAEAAAVARKYLLDYKDVSRANEVGRIINPFLTWAYKSAPLIVGEAARNPWKIQIPLELLNAVGDEGLASEGIDVQPLWQKEAGAVVLPRDIRERLPLGLDRTPQAFVPDTPIHSTLETLTPLRRLLDVARGKPRAEEELGRSAMNTLGLGGIPGGLAKSAIEAAAGKQLFSGRAYNPGTREPTPIGFNLGPLPDTLPWEQANLLRNLMPLLTRFNTFAPRTDYDRESQTRRYVSQTAGVGLYPLTPAVRRGEMYRRLGDLNAVIQSLRDRGVQVPRRTRTTSSGGGGGYWDG